jgi:hypothetical protein
MEKPTVVAKQLVPKFKSKSMVNLDILRKNEPVITAVEGVDHNKDKMQSLHMSLLNINYEIMIQNQPDIFDEIARKVEEKRAAVRQELLLAAEAAAAVTSTREKSSSRAKSLAIPEQPQQPQQRKKSFIDKYILSRFLPDTTRSKQMLDDFNQNNKLGLRLTQLETHLLFGGDSESTNTFNNEYFRSSHSPLPSLVEFYATNNHRSGSKKKSCAASKHAEVVTANPILMVDQVIETRAYDPNYLSIRSIDGMNSVTAAADNIASRLAKRRLIDLYLEMGGRGSFSSCAPFEDESLAEGDIKSLNKNNISKTSTPTTSRKSFNQNTNHLQNQPMILQRQPASHANGNREAKKRLVTVNNPIVNTNTTVITNISTTAGKKTIQANNHLCANDFSQHVTGGLGGTSKSSNSSDYILRNSSIFSGSNIVNNARLRICNKANNERKALKVLIIIFLVFVLFWTPFFLINAVSAFCGGDRCEFISDNLLLVTTWLGYASSSINPIVYTMFNKSFRIAFINLLKCQTQQSNRHMIKEKVFLLIKI